MKKLIYLLLIVCFLPSCFMMEYYTCTGNLNGFGGAGVSTILGNDSWEPKFGGVLGAETQIFRFSENAFVNTGLNLSFQGAGWDDDWGEGSYSGTSNLTYLNLPVRYGIESAGGFYGETGLQAGILLSAKDKFDGNSYDYKEYVNNFDLSVPVVLGYKFNEKMSFEARFAYGLTNLDNTGYQDKDHNLSFNIGVNYTFPFFQKMKSRGQE